MAGLNIFSELVLINHKEVVFLFRFQRTMSQLFLYVMLACGACHLCEWKGVCST